VTGHSISEYLRLIEKHNLLLVKDYPEIMKKRVVRKVAYNSKEVIKGTLFVCKGVGFQEKYLDEAIARGAIAYISERDYQKEIPGFIVSNAFQALSLVANLYYGFPWKKFKLIGITGTKGKTTTANYVKYILDEYLRDVDKTKAGLVTTDLTFDGKKTASSHLTTPESLDLQKFFYNAAKNGTQYVVVEVSSQALKYGRVYGVNFDVAVFLNISEDHISPVEHLDFEDYFSSKLNLFQQATTACVNLDLEESPRVLASAQAAANIVTFAFGQEADIFGYALEEGSTRSGFRVKTAGFDRQFSLNMPGTFNLKNALAAVAVAYSLQIPQEYLYSGLNKAKVAGRMDRFISRDKDKVVIVDYAHNKLSFNELYDSVQKQYPTRKIITVFGCPGEKAITRRRDLGLISGLKSDKIILTMEDPGEKNVRLICEEIAQYVKQNNHNYEIIEDRTEAIKRAILSQELETVVLITGKGNERYQRIGTGNIKYPSDVDNATRFLAEYDLGGKLTNLN